MSRRDFCMRRPELCSSTYTSTSDSGLARSDRLRRQLCADVRLGSEQALVTSQRGETVGDLLPHPQQSMTGEARSGTGLPLIDPDNTTGDASAPPSTA